MFKRLIPTSFEIRHPLVIEHYPVILTFAFCMGIALFYQIVLLFESGEPIYHFGILGFVLWQIGLLAATVIYNDLLAKERKNLILIVVLFSSMFYGICGFAAEKSMISYFIPYGFDQIFAQIDKFIHFGWHPYQILHVTEWPPLLLKFVDQAYFAWFFVVYLWIIALLILDKPVDAQKKIVAFLLCTHIVGVICATLMSSVGPIFWDYYYDTPNPYTPLINYIAFQSQNVGLQILSIRDLLLGFQSNSALVDANAPSAMPSMHVGISYLMFISSVKGPRWLRIFLFLYLIIVFIGSIALAWHYAIDGYVAIIMVHIIWKASDKFVDRHYQTLSARTPENPVI